MGFIMTASSKILLPSEDIQKKITLVIAKMQNIKDSFMAPFRDVLQERFANWFDKGGGVEYAKPIHEFSLGLKKLLEKYNAIEDYKDAIFDLNRSDLEKITTFFEKHIEIFIYFSEHLLPDNNNESVLEKAHKAFFNPDYCTIRSTLEARHPEWKLKTTQGSQNSKSQTENSESKQSSVSSSTAMVTTLIRELTVVDNSDVVKGSSNIEGASTSIQSSSLISSETSSSSVSVGSMSSLVSSSASTVKKVNTLDSKEDDLDKTTSLHEEFRKLKEKHLKKKQVSDSEESQGCRCVIQ